MPGSHQAERGPRLHSLLAAALGRLPALTALSLRHNHLAPFLDELAAQLDRKHPRCAACKGTDATNATNGTKGTTNGSMSSEVPAALPASFTAGSAQFLVTMVRLRQLDVSGCSGLAPRHAAAVLAACTSLKTLLINDCKCAALGCGAFGGSVAVHLLHRRHLLSCNTPHQSLA